MKTEAGPYDFLPVAGSFARGSVTLDVTNSLRAAIVNLALPPGTVLDKSAICAQFGVSRFPVSEALARLADEGLVDIAPQRGSTVSLVRIADVREYMLIRKGLESEALRVLIGKHDAEVISALHQNMAAQRAAAAKDDAELFHQLDVDFHDIIFRPCSSPRSNRSSTGPVPTSIGPVVSSSPRAACAHHRRAPEDLRCGAQ